MSHSGLVRCGGIVLAAFILGCRGGDKAPVASGELLAGIPAMPRSAPMSSAAGSEAVEAAYSTQAPPDSVAAWYRQWFLKDGWRINGDLPSPDGGVTLSVEKDRRSVWLIVRPSARTSRTTFSVVAAGSDSSDTSGSHR
ncbi:MAG: hypothetical protein HY700_11965 [Gemmatimonadetes bacterium]|nr:hypothetical protein [Gemmatimonadota bacterium]